jgi:hypothetical protein
VRPRVSQDLLLGGPWSFQARVVGFGLFVIPLGKRKILTEASFFNSKYAALCPLDDATGKMGKSFAQLSGLAIVMPLKPSAQEDNDFMPGTFFHRR